MKKAAEAETGPSSDVGEKVKLEKYVPIHATLAFFVATDMTALAVCSSCGIEVNKHYNLMRLLGASFTVGSSSR